MYMYSTYPAVLTVADGRPSFIGRGQIDLVLDLAAVTTAGVDHVEFAEGGES